MASGRLIQAVFSAGELSPLYQDRADLQSFYSGAEALENMIVLREGGVRRRAGFIHVADAIPGALSRLIPFVRSTSEGLMAEFGHEALRFFRTDTLEPLTVSPGGLVEVATPYGAGLLPGLYTWQSADVMWISHKSSDEPLRVLIRFADDDWDLEPYQIAGGPFLTPSIDGPLITGAPVTGATTLTATQPIFSADQVGGLMRLIEHPNASPHQLWAAGEETVPAGARRAWLGRVYETAAGGAKAGNQPPVHETGTVTDGKILWTYLHDGAGVVRITGFISETQVSGAVLERLPSLFATPYWAEGAFSDRRGHPRLGGIFEERMVLLSTRSQPDTFFASRTGEYSPFAASFKPGQGTGQVTESDAVTRTLADTEVNAPSWMIASDRLMFGTPRGIVRVQGPSLDEPITPQGAVARRIPGAPGACARCNAVEAAQRIVYAARGGRRLIEFDVGRSEARDLTLRAEHAGAAPFIEQAWVGEPDGRLFVLRADGRLWCLTYAPDEDVIGWSRILIGGAEPFVESIAAAPGADGRDRLWAVIRRRTPQGGVRRSVEVMGVDFREGREDLDAMVYLDGAGQWDFWNADPDAVMTLAITGGGAPLRDATGVLTCSGTVFESGHVGAEYWLDARSSPPRAGDPPAPLRVRIDAVNSAAEAQVTLLADGDARQLVTAQWARARDTITGLTHLAGETVIVFADGFELDPVTISAEGEAALSQPSVRGCAGYDAPWRGRSMPIVFGAPLGDSRGAAVRVQQMLVGYVDALQAEFGVIADGREQEYEKIIARGPDDLIGAALKPRTGVHRAVVAASRALKVQIEARGRGPWPFTLTSVSAKVAADD